MRLLLAHPSCLVYSEIFLRLEPLGLERVAGAARQAGHEVRVVDLQVLSRADLAAELASFCPAAVGISLNYLANVPAAIEIAAAAKAAVPGCFVFFGGHSVSFIADDVLAQAAGRVDAIVRGEGETAIGPLLAAVRDGGLDAVPGRTLWRFSKVYNAGRQYADHQRPVRYELPLPPPRPGHRSELYIHSRAAAGTGSRRGS